MRTTVGAYKDRRDPGDAFHRLYRRVNRISARRVGQALGQLEDEAWGIGGHGRGKVTQHAAGCREPLDNVARAGIVRQMDEVLARDSEQTNLLIEVIVV